MPSRAGSPTRAWRSSPRRNWRGPSDMTDTDTNPKTDPEFPFVVFGDFVCPWSFSVIPLVDRLAAEYGLRPWWRPHLLHPETPPGGEPIADTSRREEVRAWLREIAPESAARMRFRDRTVPTFMAFQALEWADDRD